MRLAIVGASARAAAFSAMRAGFDVVTADLFADADLRRRCRATKIAGADYPHGLADWLAEQEVDAWMYTGALENHPDLVDRMAAQMLERGKPLWGNRGDALRRCRDPFELQRVCREHGLNFPETRASAEGLPLDGSWLCKTYRGSNGSGVWPLVDAVSRNRPREATTVYQRFIDGSPCSAVISTREVLSVSQQLVGASSFRAAPFAYCGSVAPAEPLVATVRQSMIELAGAIAAAFGLRGLCGIDFVLDGETVWVVEINPRFPSSAEVAGPAEPALPMRKHAEAYGVQATTPARTAGPITGKVILYAKRPIPVGDAFHEWAMSQADAGRLADIPAPGVLLDTGKPVLTILEGGSPDGVLDRLKRRAAEVESRLYG